MKVLCIPDIHQRVRWANAILEKEADNADHIVFLGDYFDNNDYCDSIKETCEFLNKTYEKYKDKVTFLKGNHDMPYFFIYPIAKTFSRIKGVLNPYLCSGYTHSKAYEIAKKLNPNFIKNTKLACYIDGVLYSHAGATPYLFKPYETIISFLKRVDHINDNLREPESYNSGILACGESRGGRERTGGLTWCDFHYDFIANSGLPPQIFGHTKQLNGPNRKGNSWCIDTIQRYYAIITDGNPVFALENIKYDKQSIKK